MTGSLWKNRWQMNQSRLKELEIRQRELDREAARDERRDDIRLKVDEPLPKVSAKNGETIWDEIMDFEEVLYRTGIQGRHPSPRAVPLGLGTLFATPSGRRREGRDGWLPSRGQGWLLSRGQGRSPWGWLLSRGQDQSPS